ncbi:MAG: hypothetical protein WA880_04325 [Ornithinimicrobium sp.]
MEVRSMQDNPWRPPERNGAGDAAFTLGVLAVLFALIPIVGDVVYCLQPWVL